MDELTLRNTDRNSNQIIENDDSIIRRVLADIEHLMLMLSSELDQNNYSPEQQQQLKIVPSLCSTTITNVTINDDNHRLIEHLRNRINRLEHERNVLLTSYQLLIKLLK
jgi:hypothetical protein